MHPSRYAVAAEGVIDDILKLRAEIDEYLGLKSPINQRDSAEPAIRSTRD